MLINLAVIIVFALINGVTPSWSWLLVPLSLAELYLLSLGISLLLGAINVKYRDITSIWDVLMQAMFYAIPIIYPVSMVSASSELAAKIIILNPISQAIQDIRHNLITTETVTTWNYLDNNFLKILPIIIVLILLCASALYFRKKSKFFAEEV
jgi:ABC-2 type transport system permease protein